MNLRLKKLFRDQHYASMRRALIVIGVAIAIIPGIVFLIQVVLENESFYELHRQNAWQVASLRLAEVNTGIHSIESQNQYYLVTQDFAKVVVDMYLGEQGITIEEYLLRFDPEQQLKPEKYKGYFSYSGTFRQDNQHYFKSLYFLFSSDDCNSFHLKRAGKLAGCFVLVYPISQARKNLLLSHLTKLGLWLGLCTFLVFVLVGIGGQLIDQLETANQKLIDAERASLVSKIACTYNHRINSPLLGILGSIDLLSSGEKNPRKIKLIRNVGEAAESIKAATDEITALEKYHFVNYPGGEQMLAPADKEGEREESNNSTRSIGYKEGKERLSERFM